MSKDARKAKVRDAAARILRAQDDAEAALALVRQCGYARAARDVVLCKTLAI